MHNLEHHVQDRLNTALVRVSTLARTLAAHDPLKGGDRMLLDLRRLSQDLERSLVESRDAASGREELRLSAEAADKRASLLFQLSPAPSLVLDRTGGIVDANPAAARLLNTSLRHLVGRSFPMFLAGDRETFLLRLTEFAGGDQPDHTPVVVRPRERGARPFDCAIVADGHDRLLVLLLSACGHPADSELSADLPARAVSS